MRRPALAVIPVLISLLFVGGCTRDQGPRVSILRPDSDSSVKLGGDLHLTVVFTTAGFSLRPIAGCGNDKACGIAHLNIDGDACNQAGKPYNNVLEAGTLGHDFFIDAEFEHCPAAKRAGHHEITISLYTASGQRVPGPRAGATTGIQTTI